MNLKNFLPLPTLPKAHQGRDLISEMLHQGFYERINHLLDLLGAKFFLPVHSIPTVLFKRIKAVVEFLVLGDIDVEDAFGGGDAGFEGGEEVDFFGGVVEGDESGPALAVGEEVFGEGRV